jgi:hypothetical protein
MKTLEKQITLIQVFKMLIMIFVIGSGYILLTESFVYLTGGYKETLGTIQRIDRTTKGISVKYEYYVNNVKYIGLNGPYNTFKGEVIVVYYSVFCPSIAYVP